MELPALDVPLHVDAFRDAESWYRQWYSEQGITGDELEQLVQDEVEHWSGSAGVAGRAGFVVRADDNWDTSFIQRIAIHELTHVFQHRLSSWAYPNAPRGKGSVPGWLGEGMATMMEDAVLSYSTGNSHWGDIQEACDTNIQETEYGGSVYTTGAEAARLLASKVGVRGLFDLYMKSKPGDSVAQAFNRTLGFDIDSFNQDFAQHCADGRPQLEIVPFVDYPARHRPVEPWDPACKALYPEDVESPESSSIIVALTNICDFVIAFDLAIYDSVAIVDDDPVGLAELIEAHTNQRVFVGEDLGLKGNGPGYAEFLTTDLNAAPPSWLIREVGTDFARLLFFDGTPNLFTEGLGQVIPGLSEAFATSETYEHSAFSRSLAVEFEPSIETLEWDISRSDTDLSVAREAVELLLATYGLHKTATYFAQGEEIDWRVRFESAYGITPDEFYVLYDQHRENGLPDLPIDLTPFGPVSE